MTTTPTTRSDKDQAVMAVARKIEAGLAALGLDCRVKMGGSAAGASAYVEGYIRIGRRYISHDIRVSDHDCGLGRNHTGYFAPDASDAEIAAFVAKTAAKVEELKEAAL